MPLYEHVLIARQDLSQTQADELADNFVGVLTEGGGNLVEKESWGLQRMAYKINRNRKGHYFLLKTDSPAAAVQEMERLMRLHDDILRVLTVKVKEHTEGPSIVLRRREERSTRNR